MNAQNNKKDTIFSNISIELSDKISLREKSQTIKNDVIWEIYLKKKGEIEVKKLDNQKIEKCGLPVDDGISNDIIRVPRLIDAYKEQQRIYVFLYKEGYATLQIYDFKDGIDFKKHEYPLILIGGGSVMNYGPYIMTVYKKIIENVCFADVILSRSVGGGKGMLLRVQEDQVFELEFKDNEKTKRIISAITSREKEYLQKEIKTKLIEQGVLSKQDQFVYLGYLDDAYAEGLGEGSGGTYFFYKDSVNPFVIKVIKYNNRIKEWTINGYTEKRLFSTQEAERWGIEK